MAQQRTTASDNKYQCTIDQELADRRCLCTHHVVALFYMKCRHGRHLEIMTSYQKSDFVNRCASN